MNEESYRPKHKALNTLIQSAISKSDAGEDGRWKSVRKLFNKGGGIGHYVAEIEGNKIIFKICIYHFDQAPAPHALWADAQVCALLQTPRPLPPDRVMRRFKGFLNTNDTFYHREIKRQNGFPNTTTLKTSIKNAPAGTNEFFELLDKGDLSLLPESANWLFICPLPVLASPSTFLFFGSNRTEEHREDLAHADFLAGHFQVTLVNHAINSLVGAMTDDIERGTITNIDGLQASFITHLAAIFLPKTILENGKAMASASDLIADESKHSLDIQMPGRLIKLIPPAIPDCAAVACDNNGKTLCDQKGMKQKYESLSLLLGTLYRQLEATFVSVGRTQSHNILNLIDTPLHKVNDAISILQSHAQELRAILYEPDEVLLGSPAVVSPYFHGRTTLTTLNRTAGEVIIQHSPCDYTTEDAMCVLGSLFCAMLGKLEGLKKAASKKGFLNVAKKNISKAIAERAHSDLPKRLQTFLQIDNLAEFDLLNRSRLIAALNDIKNTFFAPFKSEGREWMSGALLFLMSGDDFKDAQRRGSLASSDTNINLDHMPLSPVSYACILSFIRDIVAAAKVNVHTGKKVNAVGWVGTDKISLSIEFSQAVINSDEREFLKERVIQPILNLKRDFRIDISTQGDFSRAFGMLANRIQRFNGEELEWVSVQPTGNILLKIKHYRHDHVFEIVLEANKLTINWEIK